MEPHDIFGKLKISIYEHDKLSGKLIADILIDLLKCLTTGQTIEQKLEKLSQLWDHLEAILATNIEDIHPHLQKQKQAEQSKKSLLGDVWERLFESLANEILANTNIRVLQFSKTKIKEYVKEQEKILANRFSIQQQLGLISKDKFSIQKIADTFYENINNQLSVYLDEYHTISAHPDTDLIAIKHLDSDNYEGKLLVLAVLSSKKKFRERVAQVGYWTIKFRLSQSKIKNLLVTPDEDKSFLRPNSEHKKIVEVDTDGVYVIYLDEVNSQKIKHFKFLRDDLMKILEERAQEIADYKDSSLRFRKLMKYQVSNYDSFDD